MTRFEPRISGAGGDRSTTESQTLPADSNLQPFGSPNVLKGTDCHQCDQNTNKICQ